MSLLISMFLIAMVVSKYNVAAYTFDELDSDDQSLPRLRYLAQDLQRDDDDDEDLFFESRIESTSDCTADILDGYIYSGNLLSGAYGVETTQRCMDKCDVKEKCVGWSFRADAEMCALFSKINGITAVENRKSGTCIGTSIKTTCTDKRDGQYLGKYDKSLTNVATVEECMARCDQSATCLAWVYDQKGQVCLLSQVSGKFVKTSNWITGSCLASQKRLRVPDSINLFRQEALDRHNKQREKHCSPPLTLDNVLNQLAQTRANDLAAVDLAPPDYQSANMQAVYYKGADYDLSGDHIIDCFYEESKHYNWDAPDFSKTNRFPKVIWKSSKKLGVGRAFASDNITMYVVTMYDWKGDITVSYKDNVQKACI